MRNRRKQTARATALALAFLVAGGARAGQVRQITDEKATSFDWGMINGNGSEVVLGTSTDQLTGGGNPNHLFRIIGFDPTTGVGTALTSFPATLTHVRHNVAVSEDGQWLAFLSRADIVPGQNGNGNTEAFAVKRDGTQLVQLSHDDSSDPSSVQRIALSGNGLTVAFAATSDLVGQNPQRAAQVYVVNRDGTGLQQLTHAATGGIDHMWISDDGTRIAYSGTGDPTGGNPDKHFEVFTIQVGDALPRQITSSPTADSTDANISGDGSTIVFESNGNFTGGNADLGAEIFAANWTTGTVTQVTTSTGTGVRESHQPWPTNNGQVIFFSSDQAPAFGQGLNEIFKINLNGTGKTKLTTLNSNAQHPVVSGGGERFTTWLEDGMYTATGTGTGLLKLINRKVPQQGYNDISNAGTKVCMESEGNPLGTNADGGLEVFLMNADGSGKVQLTSSPTAFAGRPTMDGAGTRVYWEGGGNPLGTNADGNDEVFGINADGTGTIQYTNCVSGTGNAFSGYPDAADNGSVLVFISLCNLTGGNPETNTGELFKVNPNGTGLTQLTSHTSPSSNLTTYVYWPRLDATGTWVVMSGNANLNNGNPENNFEIWRMKTDGTNLQQITSQTTFNSFFPDISGDGTRIVFTSEADLTGQNADHNVEVFAFEPASIPQMRQITQTTNAENAKVRLSRDGRYAYFVSTSRFGDRPEGLHFLYRYDFNTSTLERAGGGGAEDASPDYWPAIDNTGAKVAYSSLGNPTGANPDDYWEVIVADQNAPNPPVISGGPAPTNVSFLPEPGVLRYDIIRGDVANLAKNGIDTNLGTVFCVENDSGDTTTAGYDDPLTPAAGHAFFYLFRGTKGPSSGPGTYGTNASGGQRIASGGDCGI